jgi:hypothetical protein
VSTREVIKIMVDFGMDYVACGMEGKTWSLVLMFEEVGDWLKFYLGFWYVG